ncbi:MAG TPA: hypothetical protein DCF48_01730 [Rikenellaceae bacterium]|nr:hypothetical protein [Rikenellaceae bacterium]
MVQRNDILCEGSAIQNGTALLLISLPAEFDDRSLENKYRQFVEGKQVGRDKVGVPDWHFCLFAADAR